METMVAQLEVQGGKIVERLGALERDVALIKSNYATRADVAEAKNSVITWVGSAVLLAQLLPVFLRIPGM